MALLSGLHTRPRPGQTRTHPPLKQPRTAATNGIQGSAGLVLEVGKKQAGKLTTPLKDGWQIPDNSH